MNSVTTEAAMDTTNSTKGITERTRTENRPEREREWHVEKSSPEEWSLKTKLEAILSPGGEFKSTSNDTVKKTDSRVQRAILDPLLCFALCSLTYRSHNLHPQMIAKRLSDNLEKWRKSFITQKDSIVSRRCQQTWERKCRQSWNIERHRLIPWLHPKVTFMKETRVKCNFSAAAAAHQEDDETSTTHSLPLSSLLHPSFTTREIDYDFFYHSSSFSYTRCDFTFSTFQKTWHIFNWLKYTWIKLFMKGKVQNKFQDD